MVRGIYKTDIFGYNLQPFNGFVGFHIGYSTLDIDIDSSSRHPVTCLKSEHQRGERKRSEQESEQFLFFLFEVLKHGGSIFTGAKVQKIQKVIIIVYLCRWIHYG